MLAHSREAPDLVHEVEANRLELFRTKARVVALETESAELRGMVLERDARILQLERHVEGMVARMKMIDEVVARMAEQVAVLSRG